jgi:signal recognition particle subunit SEC65
MAKQHTVCIKEPHITEIKNILEENKITLIRMQMDIQYIKEALDGKNNKCGLIEKVEIHETFIEQVKAQGDLVKWLLGGGVVFSAIALLISVWQLFK